MNRYIKSYKKFGDWLALISIIGFFVLLLDYFNLFGYYEILKNRQSYLLIISGTCFLISNLIDLFSSLRNIKKLSLSILLASIFLSLFFIYMGFKMYNQPIGTCPFKAVYKDNFKRSFFK